LWVKLRRTQCEHKFSASPSNSDIARCSWHVSNGPHPDITKTAGKLKSRRRYAGLRALVSIVMPGSMTSVPSTLKPTLFRAPSVYSDVRHTAFGLSTTLWRRYQAAKGGRSRAGPVYPRKQASGLTSAMAGRVSAQTGGRGSELDAQTSNLLICQSDL
jgi:hypothetical protein